MCEVIQFPKEVTWLGKAAEYSKRLEDYNVWKEDFMRRVKALQLRIKELKAATSKARRLIHNESDLSSMLEFLAWVEQEANEIEDEGERNSFESQWLVEEAKTLERETLLLYQEVFDEE